MEEEEEDGEEEEEEDTQHTFHWISHPIPPPTFENHKNTTLSATILFFYPLGYTSEKHQQRANYCCALMSPNSNRSKKGA